MKLSKILMGLLLSISVLAISCKSNDADIKTDAQKVLPAEARVEVMDGVATLSGEFKDEASKNNAVEALAKVKGVKSVVNNASVMQSTAPEQIDTASDMMLNNGVNDATKDFPTVKAEINGGVITLTGEINKSSLPKLMMAINELKPRKIENRLTIK
jgi:osmotically-inducible protein OsmY